MIIHYHDYGWGLEWPIKRIERELTDRYLDPLIQSNQRVVLINSTWYVQERHIETLEWLRENVWDMAVLISMIDAAIPDASWFAEFGRPLIAVGNYPGLHYITLWAEVAARFINPYLEHEIDLPFMCLNRKPHPHRLRLYADLEAANLLDRGLVSLGVQDGCSPVRSLVEAVEQNGLAPNGTHDHHGIPNDMASLGATANWRRHFLNVVTETVFDVDAKYFVSEKIFKPILGSRPFLIYAVGGAERWLQDQGFESYLDDFRDVSDLDLRCPDNIVPFLIALCDQGVQYWQHKYLALLPKIQYNLQRFDQLIREQRLRIQQGIQCPT